MRNQMLAVLALGLLLGAPLKAESCPVFDGVQHEDEPWAVFAGSGSYLGVDTRDLTKERVAELKLKDETGVEVLAVDQDAPAGKAGMKEHDVILSFNGQKVEGVEQLRRMIRETPPGRQVTLGISRNGQNMSVPVTIGDRKQNAKIKIKRKGDNSYSYVMPPMPPMPPMEPIDIPSFNVVVQSSARNGLMVESLTPQLADFFGVKGSGSGVLIRSVEKGSAAEQAGLRAGDVIVRVDKDNIGDVGDWRRAVRARSGAAQVTIVRDKREQTVNMNFPQRKTRESGSLVNNDEDEIAIDVDLEELRQELDRIRPKIQENVQEISIALNSRRGEIEEAVAESQKEVRKAMREQHKAIDKAQRELEKAQREAEKD